jgi:hypothetical protein
MYKKNGKEVDEGRTGDTENKLERERGERRVS